MPIDSELESLLDTDEPPPVSTVGAPNDLPFLIVCDHAGHILPRRLGTLGLSDADRLRHIAWDIGAAEVAIRLAGNLGAMAILQTYSRLAIDCNRPPHVESSIATISETTEITGNLSIGDHDRACRIAAIFTPYHDLIGAELDRRRAAGIPTALIAVHSFTPVYKGETRPWQVGLLYNRDDRLARPLIALLEQEGGLTVGDNEPYSVNDESDYTIPVHAERRGLPYAEIEIRQDLIADMAGQVLWAERLARLLSAAWQLMLD
jgi:predicted N-formylglutamate amidohydrolase